MYSSSSRKRLWLIRRPLAKTSRLFVSSKERDSRLSTFFDCHWTPQVSLDFKKNVSCPSSTKRLSHFGIATNCLIICMHEIGHYEFTELFRS